MHPLKFMIVAGTRPDAIKMAPLYLELKDNPKFQTYICASGQHSQLLAQALEIFEIKPDFDLKVMTENQSLTGLTIRLLENFSNLFSKIMPDLILVHGDTTTAFAGALAAFYLGIPVAHVEAGLRTHDTSDPFPEEFNRQAITRISRWNFVPTKTAFENLLREGIDEKKLFLCGNTVIDSVNFIKEKFSMSASFREGLIKKSIDLLKFNPIKSKYILVTLHRRESFGTGVENVCKALKTFAQNNPDISIVFPVHLNPLVRNDVKNILGAENNIILVEPIDYDLFVFLMMHCLFIISDSGGIQEEAVSISKRVLVTRNKTERLEGIESGLLKVISTNYEEILNSINCLINSENSNKMIEINPFGSGQISKKIVEFLEFNLEKTI
jgi:UDP-N-acetylglucosamine 2-epimerase (non-hydrolysing)